MSLVDYASSSDDDVSDAEEERQQEQIHVSNHKPSPPTLPPDNQRSGLSSNEQAETAVLPFPSTSEKLPDASLLLNSHTVPFVSGNDHASRVAAAMAESASRKRNSNGLASSLSRNKIPRGTLLHSKNVPDTASGMLLPPQLRGRSNIVTEDIGRLFVKKHADNPDVIESPD
ncbi:uncharacterized protein LOC110806809 isoform X1 [Carica papaya]|uniref:uncharacterized protein LOC110806809 isoform X1 n=1 Tax=Carica papaya TaxID=3649 RepID=UPI000B8C6F74|nr:uncharacterized protein LOC110806809 isoform X1 [Carica papaya]